MGLGQEIYVSAENLRDSCQTDFFCTLIDRTIDRLLKYQRGVIIIFGRKGTYYGKDKDHDC